MQEHPLTSLALGRGRLSIARPYRSAVEREHHRQAVYRSARRAGVRVVTRSEGGEVGILRAALEISGRCLERRAVPRPPEPEPRRLREAVRSRERGDLEAVRELARTVRRLMAEMVEAALREAS
jgi:hypothetical protein